MKIILAASDDYIKDRRFLSILTLIALTIGLFICAISSASLVLLFFTKQDITLFRISMNIIGIILVLWLYYSMITLFSETIDPNSIIKKYNKIIYNNLKLPKINSVDVEIYNNNKYLSLSFSQLWHIPVKILIPFESISAFVKYIDEKQKYDHEKKITIRDENKKNQNSEDFQLLAKLCSEEPNIQRIINRIFELNLTYKDRPF